MAIYFPINIDGMEGLLAIPIGFIVAAIVLRFYTNFKQNHWFVNTLAFLTFGGTFFIIFHLLIDIASVNYTINYLFTLNLFFLFYRPVT
jgi:hypothetical protein